LNSGGFGQWLQSIGAAFIHAGQSVVEAFRSVFSTSETVAGRQPDAGDLRSVLQNEQIIQQAQAQPEQQGINDWLRTQDGIPPDSVFEKISHDIIRQVYGEMDHPYQIRQHMGKVDAKGNVTKDKWVTLWFNHNPTPGELSQAVDNYWATAGEKYGYDLSPIEFEVWEDPSHPDWKP